MKPQPKSEASAADGVIALGVVIVDVAVAFLAGVAWALAFLGVALVVAGIAMARAGQ